MYCTDPWSLWLLAKLGHPHPVLGAWLEPQNTALCSPHHSLTPGFLNMLPYSLADNDLVSTFRIFYNYQLLPKILTFP